MTKLLSLVRRNKKRKGGQFQVPISYWNNYFQDLPVMHKDGGRRYYCRPCKDSVAPEGKYHTVKLELPEVAVYDKPVISYEKQPDAIIYEAYDGDKEGRFLLDRLYGGVSDGSTWASKRDINIASLWRLDGAFPTIVDRPQFRPEIERQRRKELIFGSYFVEDPTLKQVAKQRQDDLKKLNNQQITDTAGYVYIISHPYYTGVQGYVSIGKTWNYEDRLGTYQRTTPHRDYKLEFIQKFDNRHIGERTVHKALADVRLGETEWFKCRIEEAISTIRLVSQTLS